MNHNTQYELVRLQMDISEQKVSHVLHLFLSFITCGLWMPVWLLVTVSANIEKRRLSGKVERLMAREDA